MPQLGLRLATLFVGYFAMVTACQGQHDYKVSRNLIRQGKWDEALEVLAGRIDKFPQDSEWVYHRSIALAQSGRRDEAVTALQRAHEMGVPLGRIVADSHEWLKPLQSHEVLRGYIERQGNRPTQGPMIGDLQATSVKLWVRTAVPSSVVATIQDAAGNQRLRSPIVRTTVDSHHTGLLVLQGLTPDTEYDTQWLIDGEPVTLASPCRFRTPPPRGAPVRFRLAFGGGAGYVTGHEVMWDTIGERQPDALFLLGDNMYSDDPQSRAAQRFCYHRRQSSAEFRRLVGRTAVYSIWDDHDFGTNDCSGGPAIDKPDWKLPVWNCFRENWANPAYGGGEKQPGCWYDFQVGDIHFVMLDGRYYRHRPGKTMLGPAQLAWLKQTLADSQARFRVLVSPVPWEYRTKGDSKDTWNGFKEERTEIFDFLAANKINGVLLMSADRHRSDAWRIDRPNGYPLYEFNSSRLTNNHVHPTMKQAIFSYNAKQSFGLVEFDTTATDPTVKYSVWTIDGERMHELSLKLSDLTH